MHEPEEFRNHSYVLAGVEPLEEVFCRDDESGEEAPDACRWYRLAGEEADPVAWADVHSPLERGVRRPRTVVRLYSHAELDEAVAQAYAAAGLRLIGEHLVEGAGWCRKCGSQHSEPEIARIEARTAEEAGVSDGD